VILLMVLSGLPRDSYAQGRDRPALGQRFVVVDERLAVLRDGPGFNAPMLKRLSRGRRVTLIGMKRATDGTAFCRVAVTRRTRGWIQRDALVSNQRGDDERLLKLILGSKDFDRIARAVIFLDVFPRSSLRPAVLLILGNAAEDAAEKLTREANRKLDRAELGNLGVPAVGYFMNYSALDRYSRHDVHFVFEESSKSYRYNGSAWRELLRRHPQSREAVEARSRLQPTRQVL
jgi:hypothetical protein